jgi:hypothetical protein
MIAARAPDQAETAGQGNRKPQCCPQRAGEGTMSQKLPFFGTIEMPADPTVWGAKTVRCDKLKGEWS